MWSCSCEVGFYISCAAVELWMLTSVPAGQESVGSAPTDWFMFVMAKVLSSFVCYERHTRQIGMTNIISYFNSYFALCVVAVLLVLMCSMLKYVFSHRFLYFAGSREWKDFTRVLFRGSSESRRHAVLPLLSMKKWLTSCFALTVSHWLHSKQIFSAVIRPFVRRYML